MYSGSTLTTFSGRLLGAHQKIDRVAHAHLHTLAPGCRFPSVKSILHFEGDNGPDGIKRKSPAKNEPWHYIQPFDLDDVQLIHLIENHYSELVIALKNSDSVRASFEAAWLAHAIVDGLTPAHHYPYEQELTLLHGGDISSRDTLKKKIVLPGETRSHQVGNNWKMWGPKGLFTTHFSFEWGISVLMASSHLGWTVPTADKIAAFETLPLAQWFRGIAQDVVRLDLYESYYKTGWTIPLARRVKKQLSPALIQAVTLVWYGAVKQAGQKPIKKRT